MRNIPDVAFTPDAKARNARPHPGALTGGLAACEASQTNGRSAFFTATARSSGSARPLFVSTWKATEEQERCSPRSCHSAAGTERRLTSIFSHSDAKCRPLGADILNQAPTKAGGFIGR